MQYNRVYPLGLAQLHHNAPDCPPAMESRVTFTLEVNPKIPRRLARLEELASNLWYSWDRPTRTLFSRLHTGLWDAVGHNPKAFLQAGRRAEAGGRGRRSGVSGQLQPRTVGLRHLSQRAVAPRRVRVAALVRSGGLLLRRVRFPRKLSDLLRRPGHPGRRSLQGGQRHAPAVHRRRAALPPGLLLADHRRRGQPARRIHRLRVREPAGHSGAARGRHRSAASTSICPAGA